MTTRRQPFTRDSTLALGDSPDRLLALAAVAVLVAVGVAQMADLLTFQRMIAMAGTGAELNPLVARGAETVGIASLAIAKTALIVLVASSFAIVARNHRRVAALVATFGTLAGLVGALSNVLAIA